jgi:hypothetical protein
MSETNITILIGVATTITAFFFGQSGVFQKVLDFFLVERKQKRESERDLLEKKDAQIKELMQMVDELKLSVNTLEKDLIQTTIYVKTLLAYLETLMPTSADLFIKEMAKEIRK